MAVLERLQTETAELYARVQHELDLLDERTSWLDYRLYLFRMYGFHAAVERTLAAVDGLGEVVPDFELRNNKVALLSHDLVALGVERRDLSLLPRIPVPPLLDVATALGWLWVIERATVDARDVAAHLAKQLPLEIETASAYLHCYGSEVRRRWAELAAAFERAGAEPATADAIVAGAADCLQRLHRWLRPASRDSGRIQASGPAAAGTAAAARER